MGETVIIPTNKYQTPITKELLEQYPEDVQEKFLDFVDTVPLIKWMIGERPRAKDLPRDEQGRIIVDITHPHILEDVEYFMPAIKFYRENGCYSLLKPNKNPNSEFSKWFYEEVRRCRDGYVRPSDGEWVTGPMYWFLNYCPMMVNVTSEKTGVTHRVPGFPAFWEGIYYRFHYLYQARHAGKHCMELARRGCGKSFTLAGLMSHNLVLGEDGEATKGVTTVLTAYTKEYLSQKDGTLTKFTPMIDHVATTTEFPRLMITRRESDMIWRMGYKTKNGNIKGSLNSVMGLSVKDDEGKVRGKRGFILFEEVGNYPNFRAVWDNVRDSVVEGNNPFALLYGVGTAGDDASDFSSVRTILYNPDSYGVLALDNVYDQKGKGTSRFSYFFPSYISRAGCMDKDGNSDVVKALLEILMNREVVKRGGDPASLLSVIAQMPITPAEAILKVKSNFFPVVLLNERKRQLDTNPRSYDDVYVGTLVEVNGKVEFRETDDTPIRMWPVENTEQGALEIYTMPQPGTIPYNRYIIGHDPVDNDAAVSASLSSTFVFDLFTDEIVAEYTGRKPFAEDNYEIARLLALFYNATIMYEANRKGMYAYFARKHCLNLLADCPEYIHEKNLAKYSTFGSASKGISMVGTGIVNYADRLIRDWLLKTYTAEIKTESGGTVLQEQPNLFKLKNRALIEELVSYGPDVNVDRIRALDQVMLYREHFLILYGGSPSAETYSQNYTHEEDFFDKDWQRHLEHLQRGY